ncbi:MAG TPA: outer membrane protein assembly factor BamD, partial [Thermopetrobacter sp.]|nr:outer membrane protein assembly factor BamD [Thermopetrobacter sp.]
MNGETKKGGGGVIAALLAALLLAGCSSGELTDYLIGKPVGSSDAVAPDMAAASDETKPIMELYNAGLEALKEREYKTAAKKFAEVERQHPYSKWATKAILMQAYAQYQRNAYDDAIAAAKRFLTLHPGHKDAPYAHYLIALSNYERIGDVRRDPTAARKALAALEEVARRYPDTPYARDALAKAKLARDHLAG